MPKGTLVKIAINTLLGLLLIYVWSRFVNFPSLLQTLKTVNLGVIFIFIFLFVSSAVVKVCRFKYLLKKEKLAFKDLLMLNFLSQFLSFVIPIRAGEVTKGVYLSSQYNLSFTKSLVWVFIDRFLDFWVTLIIIGIFLFIAPNNIPLKLEQTIFIMLLAFSFFLILAMTSEPLFKKLINLISKFLVFNKLKNLFQKICFNIVEGFTVLRRPLHELIVIFSLTALAIFIDSLVWLSIYKSIGINISLAKSILGDTLSALTFIIPSAPGYVGSAEAALLAIFGGILGMDNNLASAAIIIFHLLTILVILFFGLISLYLLKFDLKLVWAKIKK